MSELRHWSADGATSEERALLDASRSERPDGSARVRTLAALGAGVGVVTAASSAGAGATAGLLFKVLGVVVVAGGVTGGALAWHAAGAAPPATASSPATAAPSKALEAPPPATAATSAAAPDPEEVAPAPSTDPSTRPRAAAPHASSSASLTGEVAALERAHRALAANDPAAAARELERYRAKYPQGSLASEETVLRVQALLARKENAKAIALAESFCAAHPDSPYASRIREMVRGKEKK